MAKWSGGDATVILSVLTEGLAMKTGMNLLLWTTHVNESHFPILGRLKRCGFDGVEVPIFEGDEVHYRKVAGELDRLGLKCSTVTVAVPDANPISAEASQRQKALERLKWVIDMTATLGGDILCGPYHAPLGVFSGVGPTDDEKKRAADVLRGGAEHAAKANVRIAIEYLCRFESYFLTTAADAAELVKRVNHPNFGMMYDTFHANIEEKDPPAALAAVAKHVIHVHLSENDRGTPGKGHVQWRETFTTLKKVGYDGWLTIEAFGRCLPDLAAATRVWRDFFASDNEVCEEGLKFVKKMWAESA
jgi:D-psicose/D-tagatose/L-ribulose 3-epimerase